MIVESAITVVQRWLESKQEGKRLLGVAVSRERKRKELFLPLVAMISHSTSAFEQYQALLAVEGIARKLAEAEQSQLGRLQDNGGDVTE